MDIKIWLYNQPDDLPLSVTINVSNEFAPNDATIRNAVLAFAGELPGTWDVNAIRKVVDLDVSLT